ncbi:ABC transporter ATP-binding protein [Kitasatospora sp. NPDC001603]|uniref:ABC transporter ATP-binding protein n=1 Tax=Kitasatospora sp. NPDC001603 TaxID=3154388 RepID=UPI00332B5D70
MNGPPADTATRRVDVPTPVLRAVALTKTHFGVHPGVEVKAVRGVDLTVQAGEFVAVTGPSGAGKSTLLHLLGGLQRPDSGEIHLGGRRIDTLGEADWAVLRRRRIGIVFQTGNLVSDLTVADNIELPVLLAGHPARTARERRERLLDELGLTDRAGAAPSTLSGGERQRAALARALVNDPDLLLADEPTGSLDSRSVREVLALLTRHHDEGRTILLVTHDARVAAHADRVISLFDGLITDDAPITGTPYAGPLIDLGG